MKYEISNEKEVIINKTPEKHSFNVLENKHLINYHVKKKYTSKNFSYLNYNLDRFKTKPKIDTKAQQYTYQKS